MSHITINNMTFDYTGFYKPVFQNVSLRLSTEWRLGLVGRNGRGKTTLLRLINGDIKPDQGEILKSVKTEIFPYDYDCSFKKTRDVMKNCVAALAHLEMRMEELLTLNTTEALETYGQLLSEYIELDGYTIGSRMEMELRLMGLSELLLDRDFDTLSGGERTKLLIICLFLRKNHFILLDEPTNHLDIDGKAVLAEYLAKKSGFIVVSHDRAFLDQTVDHVLSIVKTDILLEKGNYSSWCHNRELNDAFELRTHENLTREIAILEKSAQKSRRYSFIKESQKKGAPDKGAVGAQAARLMKRAKSTERRKQRMVDDKKELLKNYEEIKNLEINQETTTNTILQVQDVHFAYGTEPLLSGITFAVCPGDRLWIKGGNGTGKSTLLNILRGRTKPNRGVVRCMPGIRIAESYQDVLWEEGFLQERMKEIHMDSGIFRTLLAHFNMYAEYFERPLETFSQGELRKIDIARALSQENHLLIMDEPLNYMDISFRKQLESALLQYKPTLIFIEHDAAFGNAVSTSVLDMKKVSMPSY